MARNLCAVSGYFLIREARGPAWDPQRGRREQAGWDAHAAFVDGLVEEGVLVLGGPIGDLDGEHALIVACAASEEEVRSRLADDPWADSILRIESIEPWTLWIRGPSFSRP
jgi:uncharacterized protein YciI